MSSDQSSSTGRAGGSAGAEAGAGHTRKTAHTGARNTTDAVHTTTRTRTSSDLQSDSETDAFPAGKNDRNQALYQDKDLHAVSSSSSSDPVPHNTWITSTTVEPAGSVTTEPFPTFWSAAADAAVPTSSSSAVTSSLGAVPSAASDASTLAQAASLGGAGSSGEVRAAVGLTAGLVLAVPIALLAAAAYMRYLPSICCTRRRKAPLAGQENDFRRKKSRGARARAWRRNRDRDIEDAPASPNSQYSRCDDDDGINEDGDEQWEEIDVRDPRSGHMEKDDGEWLESWRRGKERALGSLRRARGPLQLDPVLPLPPISLEKSESDLAQT